jgi:NitT/TauT family transport system ATP-binding protein
LSARSGTTELFVSPDLKEAIYLGNRAIALRPNPGRIARVFDIGRARPRDQLTTREHPDFLHLRRALFEEIEGMDH